MNVKVKISLGIFTLIILVVSISIFYFNTRDRKNYSDNKTSEIKQNQVDSNIDDSLTNESNEEEQSTTITPDVVEEKSPTVDSKKDNNKTNTNTNTNTNNNNTNDSKNNENKDNNNSEVIDTSDSNNSSGEESNLENDEEYIRIYNSCEFYTYSDCNSASNRIAAELAMDNNVRNTACESFAYKGKIVGYRVQIFFNDGTWKYNN